MLTPTQHAVWPPNGHLAQFILNQFEPGYQGFGVDVGASDGVSINTTFALEASHRWTIVSVEANPAFSEMLKKCRSRVEICACADKPGEATFFVNQFNPEAFSSLKPTPRNDLYPTEGVNLQPIKVPVTTVDRILEKWDFPQLDLLCVDTEGTELDVLRGCDLLRWKPRVIVTECWDKTGPIDPYLTGLGYLKKARNVHNDIWLLEEQK